jgi:hypothetical protein
MPRKIDAWLPIGKLQEARQLFACILVPALYSDFVPLATIPVTGQHWRRNGGTLFSARHSFHMPLEKSHCGGWIGTHHAKCAKALFDSAILMVFSRLVMASPSRR